MTSKQKNTYLSGSEINFPVVNRTVLLKKFPNRFLLAVAVSKRARQLLDGEKPLVSFNANEAFNPVSIAMKELAEGLIDIKEKENVDEERELIEKLEKNLDDKLNTEELSQTQTKEKKSKSAT